MSPPISSTAVCTAPRSSTPAATTTAALDAWAARVAAWATGREPSDAERVGPRARARKRDVFVYFDNDAKVRAPVDAQGLMRRLGV